LERKSLSQRAGIYEWDCGEGDEGGEGEGDGKGREIVPRAGQEEMAR